MAGIKLSIDSSGFSISQIGEEKSIRPQKGKSLLECINNYVTIDLETTGYDPRWDNIIEIGCIRVRYGEICDQYQTLVNPGFEVDQFVTDLTGITNEMLYPAPKIENVLDEVVKFIGDDIILGHNVNFDINFLYDELINWSKPPLSNNFIDTLRLSRRCFKDFPNHKLSTLVQHFGIADNTEHRGLSDAIHTHKCYEHIKRHIVETNTDLNKYKNRHTAPRQFRGVSAKDIAPTVTEFDEEHPLYNKTVVFTGALEKLLRKDAMQIVVNCGGACADNISKKVNYLVLGNNEYCPTIKDGKSTKQKTAEALILQGCDIHILSESVFYDFLKDNSESLEQKSMITKEQAAYSLIYPNLIRFLDDNHAPLESLAINELSNYSSIFFKKSLICAIRFRKKINYLLLPSSVFRRKSIPTDFIPIANNMYRIDLKETDDILSHIDNILASLELAIYSQPKEMDICHLFHQCSDAKRCVQDRETSLHCGYKRIMNSGRIFYGKNRNINEKE